MTRVDASRIVVRCCTVDELLLKYRRSHKHIHTLQIRPPVRSGRTRLVHHVEKAVAAHQAHTAFWGAAKREHQSVRPCSTVFKRLLTSTVGLYVLLKPGAEHDLQPPRTSKA